MLKRIYLFWLHKIVPPSNLKEPFDNWLLKNNTRVNDSYCRFLAKANGVEYNPIDYHTSDDERIAKFAARLPEPLGDRKVPVTVFRGGEVFKRFILLEIEKFGIKPE